MKAMLLHQTKPIEEKPIEPTEKATEVPETEKHPETGTPDKNIAPKDNEL